MASSPSQTNEQNGPTASGDESPERDTLLIEDYPLRMGFTQIPNLILWASNLTGDAKLLYAILLGYAWQESHCFPGYRRLCGDMGAGENKVRRYMRELEEAGLVRQKRRGLGKTNIYTLTALRASKIEVLDSHKGDVPDEVVSAAPDPRKRGHKEDPGDKDPRSRRPRSLPPVAPHRGASSVAQQRSHRRRRDGPANYSGGLYGVCSACGCSPHDAECPILAGEGRPGTSGGEGGSPR